MSGLIGEAGAMDFWIPGVCGFGLHLRLDGFRLIYLAVAILMWLVSGVFSKEYMAHYEKKTRYYVFFWATFLATAGVFLSEDLYTTFLFFEIMSFTSYVWVAFDEKQESLRAAQTYLAVAVIGGLVMLMGLYLLYDLFGTLDMDRLRECAALAVAEGHQARLYAAGGLLLFGFGAKAGCFPLHIWLPKAHPVAPAPASALLSGILTKTGIFGIIVVSCRIFGTDVSWGLLIVGLGLVTMFVGALLAVFSVNLKRTLACSSVSQIGFILTGIGMSVLLASAGENPSIAARGALLHMVNHSLFKLVLFLCAAAVFMNLHQLDLNQIQGFGRKKPLLADCFLMGALGISGIPGWSGYVSKTLIHESIVEYRELIESGAAVAAGPFGLAADKTVWMAVEWIFLFTGGMTVSYMLKLFVALFVEENSDRKRQAEFDGMGGGYMKKASALALAVPAALVFALGMTPDLTMNRLADLGQCFFLAEGMAHPVSYFSLENIKGGLISIGIGIVLYFLVIRKCLMSQNQYVDRWPGWLDLENLIYRPVLTILLPGVCGAVFGFLDRYLLSTVVMVFLAVSAVVCRAMDHLADGIILLLRRTTHRSLAAQAFRNAVPAASSGANKLIRFEDAVKRNARLVEESFSFGLMLFCLGLCLTLGYLLFVFVQGYAM